MIHVLKITSEMWEHIDNGTKILEIRKLNKDHISIGDTILYVNLRLDAIYGIKAVRDKIRCTREQVLYTSSNKMDSYTLDFVKSNYRRVKDLLVFEIGEATTCYHY